MNYIKVKLLQIVHKYKYIYLYMVCFIVFYIETFPILRLYTVMYVVYIMIYFFEIYMHEDRKGFYIKDNKTYHIFQIIFRTLQKQRIIKM